VDGLSTQPDYVSGIQRQSDPARATKHDEWHQTRPQTDGQLTIRYRRHCRVSLYPTKQEISLEVQDHVRMWMHDPGRAAAPGSTEVPSTERSELSAGTSFELGFYDGNRK